MDLTELRRAVLNALRVANLTPLPSEIETLTISLWNQGYRANNANKETREEEETTGGAHLDGSCQFHPDQR